MPWWSTAINTILFGVIIVFAVYWPIRVNRVKAQNLPEFQVSRLREFAEIAVRGVAFRYPQNPSKRDLALAAMTDLYKEYGSPVPSRKIMELAIDAVSLQLPNLDG